MNEGFVFPWKDIIVALSAASMIGGLVIAWVRTQLSPDFAKKKDITDLSDRIEKVETQMRGVPSHADMRLLSDRIGLVERGVDVVGAEMRGVTAGVNRVEADMRLIKDHLLNHKDGER
jgi:putative N-acetylmannosamine-6-phosphate epimerase